MLYTTHLFTPTIIIQSHTHTHTHTRTRTRMIKSTIINFFFKKEKNRKVVLKDLTVQY